MCDAEPAGVAGLAFTWSHNGRRGARRSGGTLLGPRVRRTWLAALPAVVSLFHIAQPGRRQVRCIPLRWGAKIAARPRRCGLGSVDATRHRIAGHGAASTPVLWCLREG